MFFLLMPRPLRRVSTTDRTPGEEQISTAVNRINEMSFGNKESIEILIKQVKRFKV
jgi:hypothetical protein